MNMSTLTDTLTERIPSRAAAASSSISSTFDDMADRLRDIDLEPTVRRTRRTVARVVPGMSPPRRRMAVPRWLIVSAAVLATVAVISMLRRGSSSEHEMARDDWMTPRSDDSPTATTDREREPAHSTA